LDLLSTCALFVAGLVFGSFLNVCISRLPRDLSIVTPGSFCPHCETPIPWRDNIPLLSWLLLRGHCRKCGASISRRYPAVELLTAVFFVACYASFGSTWLALKAGMFGFLVIGLIFMDAETGLLPHEFTYTGIVLGLAFAGLAAFDASGTAFVMRAFGLRDLSPGPELWLLDAAIGAAFGAGFFYVAWGLYYLARKREGIGLGDIALIAMVGAFLGLKLTVLVVFLSPILGTLFAVGWLFRDSAPGTAAKGFEASDSAASNSFLSQAVPFGVFLGSSSLLAMFFGEKIWSWYLGLFR